MNLLHYKNITKSVKFDYTKKEQYYSYPREVGHPYDFLYEEEEPFIYNPEYCQIQDREKNLYTLEPDRAETDIRYIEDVNGIRYYFCYRVKEECYEEFELNKTKNLNLIKVCYDKKDTDPDYDPKKIKLVYNKGEYYIGFLDRNTNHFYNMHLEKRFIAEDRPFHSKEIIYGAYCYLTFLKDAAGLKKVVYKNGDTYYYLKDYEYILPDAYKNKSFGWQWQVYQRAKNKLPIIRDINNKEYFYSKNSVNNDYLIDKKGKRYYLTLKNNNYWRYSNYFDYLKLDFLEWYERFKNRILFSCYETENRKFLSSISNSYFRFNSSIYPIGYILQKQYYNRRIKNKVDKYKINFKIN